MKNCIRCSFINKSSCVEDEVYSVKYEKVSCNPCKIFAKEEKLSVK